MNDYIKTNINDFHILRKIGIEKSRFSSRQIEWYCNNCKKKEVKREDKKCPYCDYDFEG